jgi:hypothetical protein
MPTPRRNPAWIDPLLTFMVRKVSGSSPEEGLKYLQIALFCCLFWR